MSYLEEFLDKISFLPNDINRYLRHIRELDEKGTTKYQELENKQIQYLNTLKMSKDRKAESRKKETKQLYEDILVLQEDCSGMALEKIEISNQIHEQLDDYIQKLDKDIKRFEHEIKESNALEMMKEPANDYMKNEISSNQRKKKKYESKMSKYKSKKKVVEKQPFNLPDQPPDLGVFAEWNMQQEAVESKYCYCNKELQNCEMICCDNPFCEREWFHFQCVGLKKKPKDNEKWYCKECKKVAF